MTQRLAWLPILLASLAGLPGCHTFFKTVPPESWDHVFPDDPKPAETAHAKSSLKEAGTDDATVAAKLKPNPPDPPPTVVPTAADVSPAETENPEAPRSASDTPEKPARPGHYAPLVEALQCVLDERHQEALQHLKGYDRETQEFYLRALPTLTIFARKKLNDLTPQEVTVLKDELQSLDAQLRPRAELVIDRACFCKWYKAFGVYEPLPESYAFLGGTLPDRPGEGVWVYAELRNFANELRDGWYVTKLSATIEVRDEKGEKLIKKVLPTDGQPARRSLSRINDLFGVYGFYLTPDIPPGNYQLVLQIVDETIPERRRVARKALDFRVTPVVSRAASR
jgi:hypothetical protein